MQRTYVLYCATSPSGKRYVGQTVRGLRRRWQAHTATANSGKARITPLINAIRKYGGDAFELEVLAIVYDKADADALERAFIDLRSALVPTRYNVSNGGVRGFIQHDRVRAKLRAAWARNPARKLALREVHAANRGRTASPTTRDLMRAAHTGLKSSAEATAKRKAWWTPERRAAKALQTWRRYHPNG